MEVPVNSSPASSDLDASSFDVSQSLVPPRDVKSVGVSAVDFDGLLTEPLRLKEDLRNGCGGQLWPAGMVLAKYLLRRHQTDLAHKSILELGAGGGLVGLAVARGCRIETTPIYITDQEPMLHLMETNIELNGLTGVVRPAVLNWGEPLPAGVPTHPAVILAADCVYFEPAFPLLIATLRDLLGPDSVCYFCFKRRRRADLRFVKMARKAFQVDDIGDDPDAPTYKKENIFLYAIRPKQSATLN